ncbi:MAG: mercuric transporter MerT family protein [Alphaproteobacteria bacterium]
MPQTTMKTGLSPTGDGTDRATDAQASNKTGWLAAGGLLGAFGAATCCLIPFALIGAGVGTAWVGNLTALAPYQPIFIVLAIGLLGAGFFFRYRKARACAVDRTCANPASARLTGTVLWSGLTLLIAALAFPAITPYLS